MQPAPVYNKQASFFDNFSVPDRADEQASVRHDAMNTDTFGDAAVSQRQSQRVRGRGRGRGGSRGGRGGFRGGSRGGSRGGNRGGSRGGRGGRGGHSQDHASEDSTKNEFRPAKSGAHTEFVPGADGGEFR